MIDIFARWADGKLVCEPKKRRGMTKGEYLRAVYACEQMNKQDEKKPDRTESDRAKSHSTRAISASTR